MKPLLLRCMIPVVALFGNGAMSDLRPLRAAERTSGLADSRGAIDPKRD